MSNKVDERTTYGFRWCPNCGESIQWDRIGRGETVVQGRCSCKGRVWRDENKGRGWGHVTYTDKWLGDYNF